MAKQYRMNGQKELLRNGYGGQAKVPKACDLGLWASYDKAVKQDTKSVEANRMELVHS
jgi:hypothetical protein